MKQKILLSITAFLLLIASAAQAQKFAWAKKIGGTTEDYGETIAVDAFGNVYTAGTFAGTADFDPGPGTYTLASNSTVAGTGNDIFITKFDALGNFIWAKQIQGANLDECNTIKLDAVGNIYLAGNHQGTADFDPGPATYTLSGGFAAFILKLDPGGNFLWVKEFKKGTGSANGVSVANFMDFDGFGNIFTTGFFTGTVDFDPGAGAFDIASVNGVSGSDIFVSKLDASGNFVWAKSFGNITGGASNLDEVFAITADPVGNVYACGSFTGTVDFDPGVGTFSMTSAGNLDCYMVKLDAFGNFAWAKRVGGTNQDVANSICLDVFGYIYIAGYFAGTADFDPGPGTFNLVTPGQNAFISKMDDSGNLLWAKQIGTNGWADASSLAVDLKGNVYTIGTFDGNVDFDPGSNNFNINCNGGEDVYVTKLDSIGDFVWATRFGGADSDWGGAIFVDSSENVYTTGEFTNLVNFYTGAGTYNLTSDSAVFDVFVHKMSQKPYDHFVQGNLYHDISTDCVKQIGETGLQYLAVEITPYNIYATPNDTGYYSIGVDNFINYTLTPIIPQRLSHMIENPCPVNYSVALNATNPIDTSGFDFGFDCAPCYQLRVDVSSDRRRRCFRNTTSVFYINEGLASVNGVEVYVKMGQYDIPLSASMPYTYNANDSSMVFSIGTLAAGQSGLITIVDSIACVNGITGLTQCTEAWILPPNQCLIDSTTGPSWDHSSIKVTGYCENDTVRFVIKNSGSGNMLTPSVYRIYEDNVLMLTVPFQLNSGDSIMVNYVSGGATIRLEADQHPQHPGNSHPRETIEACGTDGSGTYSMGKVNLAPQDDEDVDIEIDCMEIRDSYDPNLKENSPLGIGNDHIVLPETLLDYTIHFQNTGSDTAYKIVVVDSLSSYFDLSTLEPGSSSHSYKMTIGGKGKPVLIFTFNNINLVDSTTNEPLSHGFVKFKIAPKNNVPLGTRINNNVDIYFDYNTPVRTNTAFVTLGNYQAVSLNEYNSNLERNVLVYPNPFTQSTTLEIISEKENLNAEVFVYDVFGKIVYIKKLKTKKEALNPSLSGGVYFYEVKNGKTIIGKGKMIVQ